ncbi:MAG: hypothetical protein US86_C0003G0052 [Candidatus Daviesbacteria bacterium GW2011_GWA2_38_24]|uniref:LytR/CpsA/Psr regulator C-terminal domain-containing protein n=1 Tax=Candidatus Daviesbacteria bacterium GW2011_GWA2_38_24 TaxID=1618422 RepID=A0A0G0LZK5_9BACT|nr:MAG: hypothetical protein US86_C0003G0052 [Candidatus Daviesbacteria bacterium GW2011_GWA2_38_24]KKQ79332.1 MAG: hypothetical protein UT01_C0042G0003 [Candidatus Daviesbacteria bacterium GW2011_GWA1_38_7]
MWDYNKLTALGILGLLSIFLIWVLISKTKEIVKPQPTEVVQQPAVQTETQTENPEESTISKDILKIQILNGTGKVGLAAELKGQLTSAGYQSFEVGNSEEPQKVDTEMRVKENLPQIVRDDIVQLLEETFENIAITFQSADTGFDIVIVTGKLK